MLRDAGEGAPECSVDHVAKSRAEADVRSGGEFESVEDSWPEEVISDAQPPARPSARQAL